MSEKWNDWSFGTLNAKRMLPGEIARSFVMPNFFPDIAGPDHCYIVGPRGSGKTTLLRMLQGESLVAWNGEQAEVQRRRVVYSSIFLPTDELWASQISEGSARAAFGIQMLSSFLDTVVYRLGRSGTGTVLHPLSIAPEAEKEFVLRCCRAWRIEPRVPTIAGIQQYFDENLLRIREFASRVSSDEAWERPLMLLMFGVQAVNEAGNDEGHRWALLLDEMELAPASVHRDVQKFIRGGAGVLTLKLSMSPFDRYMHTFGGESTPMPANDYQVVYLSGQSRQDMRVFTEGLWRQSMRVAGHRPVSMRMALDDKSSRRPNVATTLRRATHSDAEVRSWATRRGVNPDRLESLSYNERSATVRKVLPLLIFREAIQNPYSHRGRKKVVEVFSGSANVIAALEGNPRWIKSVFSDMLRYYDEQHRRVPGGAQYDALQSLAKRFSALLEVLPSRGAHLPLPVPELIRILSKYFHDESTGKFTPDPQACFVVDSRVPEPITEAVVAALYAGAVVHLRDRKSESPLGSLSKQRFRLAYILGVRQDLEFPIRLGKSVALSAILSISGRSVAASNMAGHDQLDLEIE